MKLRVKDIPEDITFDCNRLYRLLYGKYLGKYKHPMCSPQCLFFKDIHTPVQLSFKEAILIQQRLLRVLYKQGYIASKTMTHDQINKEINRIGHLACALGPLDFSHWLSTEHYFPVSKLMESVDNR